MFFLKPNRTKLIPVFFNNRTEAEPKYKKNYSAYPTNKRWILKWQWVI